MTGMNLQESAEQARAHRAQKAAALRAVGTGEATLRVILRYPLPSLANVPVHKILDRCPGFGKVGVKHTLQAAGVWPLAPLGSLTQEQRQAIFQHLPRRIR